MNPETKKRLDELLPIHKDDTVVIFPAGSNIDDIFEVLQNGIKLSDLPPPNKENE